MKESLQEQLSRLKKSVGLKTSVPNVIKPQDKLYLSIPKETTQASNTNSYESFILEIEKLKVENQLLSNELIALKANPDIQLNILNSQLNETIQLLQVFENSNKTLTEDNSRLIQKLSEFPAKEDIENWKKKASDTDTNFLKIIESEKKLADEKEKLKNDKSAFEFDLVRLEELDNMLSKLADEQKLLSDSQEELETKIINLKNIDNELSSKKASLIKLNLELNNLKKQIGDIKSFNKNYKKLLVDYANLSKIYKGANTRIRNLTASRDIALQAEEDARKSQKIAELNSKKINLDLAAALSKLAALPDAEVVVRSFDTVQWIVSQFEDPYERVVPKQVLLIGDGPWPMDDFTAMLQNLGFEIWQNGCDADIEVVIVGRDNWSEMAIDSQIEERDGESLRVYPQELFVLLLAINADPLQIAESEVLMKFVEGHPIFDYLFNQEFPWPDTTYEDGPPLTIAQGGFEDDEVSSPLYKLGYSVAQQVGLNPQQRHTFLEETYTEENLPWCISDEYMEDWGIASSRKRLRRIAWHLYLMTKRFRRHDLAVAKWESDLDWLKRNYYKPIYRFRWPA
jgi:hypothetical protein